MNKKSLLIIGVVAVIVIGAIAFYMVSMNSNLNNGNQSQQSMMTQSSTETVAMTQTQTQTQTQTKATVPVKAQPNKTVGAADTTYTDALKKYEGRRMQVNASCQVTPFYVTYTNGTSIMLDNRSDSAKTLKFDSVAYSIPAYGFKIVKLSVKAVPHEIP